MRGQSWLLAALVVLMASPATAHGRVPVSTPLFAVFEDPRMPGTDPQLQVVEPDVDTQVHGTCLPRGESTLKDPVWIMPFRAGAVEHDFLENGTPRTHPERGLGRDLYLDGAVLEWALELPDDTHLAAGLQVHAELRRGDPESWSQDAASDSLLASGASSQLAGRGVHQVAVRLDVHAHHVPRSEGFTLVVRLQDGRDCTLPDPLRALAVSRRDARTRLVVESSPTIAVESVVPEVAGGFVTVRASVQPTFGSQDLDLDRLLLEASGPAPTRDLVRTVSAHPHVHGRHLDPVEVTWVWRYEEEQAPPGNYSLVVTATNRAGSSGDFREARLVLGPDGAHGVDDQGRIVPARGTQGQVASAPAAMLVALACAAVARAMCPRDAPHSRP